MAEVKKVQGCGKRKTKTDERLHRNGGGSYGEDTRSIPTKLAGHATRHWTGGA